MARDLYNAVDLIWRSRQWSALNTSREFWWPKTPVLDQAIPLINLLIFAIAFRGRGRSLCFGIFRIRLVGFVVTDHATGSGADLAVTSG
jgi:hypothetical protein